MKANSGSSNVNSKTVIVIDEDRGILLEVKGLRSLCTLLWGKTSAGVPRRISTVIEAINSNSKVEGLSFRYKPEDLNKEIDVIGNELGI